MGVPLGFMLKAQGLRDLELEILGTWKPGYLENWKSCSLETWMAEELANLGTRDPGHLRKLAPPQKVPILHMAAG